MTAAGNCTFADVPVREWESNRHESSQLARRAIDRTSLLKGLEVAVITSPENMYAWHIYVSLFEGLPGLWYFWLCRSRCHSRIERQKQRTLPFVRVER